MVLSEVLNELSTTTLFVERERGDVEFDSIRVLSYWMMRYQLMTALQLSKSLSGHPLKSGTFDISEATSWAIRHSIPQLR